MKRNVGIRDVALEANVSIASVSRAINHPQGVSPEVKRRIDLAIIKLGYIPDAAARALASRSTRTIGAIIPTIDNAMFARGIAALQKFLDSQGYLLVLTTNDYDPEIEYRQALNLIGRGVDALLLRGDTHTDEMRALLAQQRTPFINVGVYHPDKAYPSIGTNNEKVAYQACRYMLDLGHRQIGVVAALTRHNDRSTARVNGIRRALAEANLPLREDWCLEVPYRLDDASQAARALLRNKSRPTGVLCGNDVIAYGVLLEAQEMGLSVPGDVSIIGFDDLEWSRHLRPRLTTIHVPIEELWQRAGDYLVRILRGEAPQMHFEMSASLVVRESTRHI